ncbi:PREDICTED: remorin-like [Erythranthe guttata]|nr:PREDICTED: remorin-like [Erythranthe guttata]|eukprot:XP_012840188.1 PREDICTED: remorin-like [Erythranthe guttata]
MAAPEEVVSRKSGAAEPPLSGHATPPRQDHDFTKVAESEAARQPLDRDIAMAKLEHEKKLSFIKAWEEREKSKVENKAQKRQAKVSSWENSKKASLEAQLKKIQVIKH